jgi:D-amino-acid oxidase
MDVYPTRGQIVLVVDAPNVKHTITSESSTQPTYIIPRGDGTVVLGGTRDANEYSLVPDTFTTKRILQSCQSLCPELKSSRVIDVWTGLRPSRRGGIRMEKSVKNVDGREVTFVHHYGHGGFGFQSSWGSALAVMQILRPKSSL